jgi:hypothetical protein
MKGADAIVAVGVLGDELEVLLGADQGPRVAGNATTGSVRKTASIARRSSPSWRRCERVSSAPSASTVRGVLQRAS